MSVGLEVEVPSIGSHQLTELLSKYVTPNLRCELHDDGSIRKENQGYAGVTVFPILVQEQEYYPADTETLDMRGPEIVSRPHTWEEIQELAAQLSMALWKCPENSRASVHVHVSGFQSWRHIQNLLRWFYYLEAPLYRLAAFRGIHRGYRMYRGREQDYNYCRPLSNPIHYYAAHTNTNTPTSRMMSRESSSPVRDVSPSSAMRRDDNAHATVPLINTPGVITATTFGQMLYHWGRLDYYWEHGGLEHYSPHRLHGINIASLLRYRTVEFRLFNGVYKYLPDMIAIVKALYYKSCSADRPNVREPMILGGKYSDFTVQDLENILEIPLRHIWGDVWPRGAGGSLVSHYSHNTVQLAADVPMQRVEWNALCVD